VRPASFLFLGAAATIAAAASGQVAPGAPSRYRYTTVEATRGEVVYAERCAACHGDVMDGAEEAPPLVGERFDGHWRDQPAELFSKVKRSMPQDDPGSLTVAQATDVVAAILHANGVQPTATDTP
jgi:mono/diheme cytochrome c family protein